MLSQILRAHRRRAAVRRCQLRLGPQLLRDYGMTAGTTLGQITHALQRAKLPQNDLELACAAFMTETEFNAAIAFPQQSYAAYRAVLRRHAAARGTSQAFQPATANSDAFAGASGWPTS